MADYTKSFPMTLPAASTLSNAGWQGGIEQYFLTLPAVATITNSGWQGIIEGEDTLVIPAAPTLVDDGELVTPNSNPSGVWLYDASGPTYIDYLAEAISDVPDDVPFPETQNDILYIGGGSKFYIVQVDLTTAGVGTYTIVFEYWDGDSWETLTKAQSDHQNYLVAEITRLVWFTDEPGDWASCSVQAQDLYWIRIRCTSGTLGTQPLGKRIKLEFSSQAFSETLTDTITVTDALTQGAGVNLSDGVSLADDLDADAGVNLGDTINLADNLIADASKQLADGISLADQLAQAAHVGLADTIILNDTLILPAHITLGDVISLTDDLRADAHVKLSDIVSLNDTLIAGNQVFLGDTIHLADDLALGAGINLADDITLTDQIIVFTPSILLEDTITLTDNIDNIIPGVCNVAVGETIKNWNQPMQWEKAVSNNPCSLSGITDSSTNTTFGQENPYTVLDASAWNLSKVEVGYIAVTTSGFMGVVISIGSNTVTVQSWHKAGIERVYGATDLPEDGESVTIHYRLRAKRVLIRSKEGNSNTIYVEQDGRYMDTTSGHPIVATQGKRNSEVEISAPRDRWLNLSRIWITSLTNQTAVVIVDGEIPHTRGE